MKSLPKILIYGRLVAGAVILLLTLVQPQAYKNLTVTLIAFGLVSDIFDGIIARRLKVSTERLRRLDSAIDQVFWIVVAISTYLRCEEFFSIHLTKMIVLFSTEVLTYVVCFIKFRKEVATHAISSKFWTLSIFATLVQLTLTCDSSILFEMCFYIGIVTRLEIIGIIVALRDWTNDVPSFYHALSLRRGRSLKRNDWLNG